MDDILGSIIIFMVFPNYTKMHMHFLFWYYVVVSEDLIQYIFIISHRNSELFGAKWGSVRKPCSYVFCLIDSMRKSLVGNCGRKTFLEVADMKDFMLLMHFLFFIVELEGNPLLICTVDLKSAENTTVI